MKTIGVVLPTIQGRRSLYDRTREAFLTLDAPYPIRLRTERDHPNVGTAWNAGAEHLKGCTWILFALDDATPHAGWADAAIKTCLEGYLPATTLETPDGRVEAYGSDGEGRVLRQAQDGQECRQTGVPFIPRKVWDAVGAFLPIHYYVDDNWYCRARALGHHVHVCTGLRMTHHDTRDDSDVNLHAMEHRQAHLDHCAQLGISAA